jgi:integrase
MPRAPRGKRIQTSDGAFNVAAKNPNGDGSVYYEAPVVNPDGATRPGRWRATYRDERGKVKRVAAPTRAAVEQRRDERLAQIANGAPSSSRFSRDTTVAELIAWWLNSVARHQVRVSTFDSYQRFGRYLSDDIGHLRVVDVDAETIIEWQSAQLDKHAPLTVLNSRKVARQAFAEAARLRLIPSNPFDLVKPPRAQRVNPGRALPTADAKALILAAQQFRLGAAVTLLFCQGWRVSEVLGLAWEDLDLEAGTAHIRRGAAYTPSTGTSLGQTKTSGASGVHFLAPVSVEHLRQRRARQNEERLKVDGPWPKHTFDGEHLTMVFTSATGQLANRQNILQTIERAARVAGIDPSGLGTHSGRRTVITALYADGGVDLADIARHVGHSDTATTAEYVKRLGNRPIDTARRAAELLDPTLGTSTKSGSS